MSKLVTIDEVSSEVEEEHSGGASTNFRGSGLVKRRAPPLPAFHRRLVSTPEFQYVDDITSDFTYIKYSTRGDRSRTLTTNYSAFSDTDDCVNSIINKLIAKENDYVLKLQTLVTHMNEVSTVACKKLDILSKIIEFHKNVLLPNLLKAPTPLDIGQLYKHQENQLELYVVFAKNRRDFSYLVMETAETIVDHFKGRLLEYNFSLTQMKNVCFNDFEIKAAISGAEEVIKHVYEKINDAMKIPEGQKFD